MLTIGCLGEAAAASLMMDLGYGQWALALPPSSPAGMSRLGRVMRGKLTRHLASAQTPAPRA